MPNTLIIFSRFPVPGQTKTRLIPARGAEGAAQLQEAMTGHTVLNARVWAASQGASITVRTTGAESKRFRHWLGADLPFIDQGGGDLGQRMARAVEEALNTGAKRVVIIGCDAPDLSPRHLDEAFAALESNDAVFGPAQDGGYYLVGLRAPNPMLFTGIEWGGGDVMERTRCVAEREGLRWAELETLHDVDHPEDLERWQRHVADERRSRVSVIIPTWNEAERVACTVQRALDGADEVIVADAGSEDGTVELAKGAGARVILAAGGRGAQMNAGAVLARGEFLLFLHGDTRLPEGFADAVRGTLSDPQPVAGAFELGIDAAGWRYRLMEWGVRQRTRWASVPYGDQALFLRRDTFVRLGGFAQWPLLEDYELVRRLRRRGKIRATGLAVTTSARRWRRLGVARTLVTNQRILLGHAMGVPVDRLARLYRGNN